MRLASPRRRRAMAAYSVRTEVVKGGISFGSALAIAISWTKNQSVLWAIFHGFCSWLYVIYHVLTRP
jgi:hypothetical protein